MERRLTRQVARRRKTVSRLYRTAGPVIVLILLVVALLVFLGGPKSGSGAETTLSTASAGTVGGSALLVIEQDGTVPALALFVPNSQRNVALAMPGTTLVKTATGFKTLGELHASDEDEALASALGEMLGEDVGAVAAVQWSHLVAAMSQTGSAAPPPAKLEATRDGAALAVDAVLVLVGARDTSGGATIWDQMELTGDAAAFRKAMNTMALSISGGAWSQAVLPGKPVEGLGFTYFEPDVEGTKALLAGESRGAALTLEVQNGSGVLGASERAAQLLEPLGYALLPFRNSPDFPDVKQTRIVAAPDDAAEAGHVGELLGVGKVEQDPSLDPGHIIVVVGADFTAPPSTTTASTE
jgi:hypothetical protein